MLSSIRDGPKVGPIACVDLIRSLHGLASRSPLAPTKTVHDSHWHHRDHPALLLPRSGCTGVGAEHSIKRHADPFTDDTQDQHPIGCYGTLRAGCHAQPFTNAAARPAGPAHADSHSDAYGHADAYGHIDQHTHTHPDGNSILDAGATLIHTDFQSDCVARTNGYANRNGVAYRHDCPAYRYRYANTYSHT